MADDKADFEVELIDTVSRPAKKAGGAMERLKKTMSRFNDSALGGALSKLSGFAKSAMVVGGTVGAALAGGIAAATVGMVDFGQRSRQAFSLLAKEGEVPEQLFQRSIGLAQDLGLNIKDTTKQVQKFRALQFSQNQAEALIKMGADMQALGASGEEVSRIFAQLGQIKAKNKLQQEELTTLAESGVSTQVVYAALAKQMGKTEDQVKALVSAGEIDGANALNAIGTAILFKTGTKQFGEAGRMMAEETLSGMANQLKAKAQATLLTISDRAAPAINKAAGVIFKELDSFFESKSGQQFFDGVADVVSEIADGIRSAIPFLKQFAAGFGEGAGAAFTEVAGAFKMFLDPLTKGDGKMGLMIMKSIGQTVGVLTVLLGGLIVTFGLLAAGLTVALNASMRTLKGTFDVFVNTFGAIASAVANFFANIGAIWSAEGMSLGEKSYEIGKQIVMGLVRGIKELYMLPGNTILGLAANTIAAAKGAFQQHSPSKVFEDIGKNNVLGLNKGHELLPVQSTIASTLGNDNGIAPVRGNLGGAASMASAASGGASKTISITVGDIQVSMQAGATPQETGEAVAAAIRDAVHDYFNDMALEEAV